MTLQARIKIQRGSFRVETDLEIESGKTLAILGPNGSGKTTLLQAIAGLVELSHGEIQYDGLMLESPSQGIWVAPEKRHVGVCFQDHRLFPFLSVGENVAFGLRARGIGKKEARRQARVWLERVGMPHFRKKKTRELSGGEAQRVALARALAGEPSILLLDEPLSSLDVETKKDIRRLLGEVLRDFKGVKILITHDPLEAVSLGDRIMILENGKWVQEGTAEELRRHPRSTYAASLVGLNYLSGEMRIGEDLDTVSAGEFSLSVPSQNLVDGAAVVAIIHPRAIVLSPTMPSGSARNVFPGYIASVDVTGEIARCTLDSHPPLTAEITESAVKELGLEKGKEIWVSIKATEIQVHER